MGQAKGRGTLEERQQAAELRNRLLKHEILSGDNQLLKQALQQHGIQRVAVSMIKTKTIHKVYDSETTNRAVPH